MRNVTVLQIGLQSIEIAIFCVLILIKIKLICLSFYDVKSAGHGHFYQNKTVYILQICIRTKEHRA